MPNVFAKMRGDHAALRVPDFEASKRWFTEKLEFRVLEEWTFDTLQCAYLAPAADDTFLIELVGGNAPTPRPGYASLADSFREAGYHHISLRVGSVDDTLAELRRRGVVAVGEPGQVDSIHRRFGFIADPWGNLIALVQLLR